jgi:hypothetical protein
MAWKAWRADPLDDVLRDLYGRAHVRTAERARWAIERADACGMAKGGATRWRTDSGGFATRARCRVTAVSVRQLGQQCPHENRLRASTPARRCRTTVVPLPHRRPAGGTRPGSRPRWS